nr:serine/threonine-protein kinase/endoribonuclease IRE1 [Tanacetum cinerariifolium]
MASDRRMWMVSSPTGTCYLAHKDTGKIKWLAETNNQLRYIACKGDDVMDYVDLKPQNEYHIRASPAWSIRCSRLKAWFLAYKNKEIYRLECVVFHARDSCKFFYACKRFIMMPSPEANPLNQFILTSNLYETKNKIECLATGVVIADGKHNMSIIEGTYDKVKAVVKKLRIMDDSKGTELKKKLRDACFHENLVALLGCESDNEYNDYTYEGGITLANHIRRHPYVEMDESSMKIITGLGVHLLKDVVAVNPGLVDKKDIMKLVGTNAEVIDLLKKIGIVQLQTTQPRPSWHSKFTTLMNSMVKILNTNIKAGWKYDDGKISSLIRLASNERSHCEETRAKVAITSNPIHGDYIVKGRELGMNDTEI